jgi:hypothetical protein
MRVGRSLRRCAALAAIFAIALQALWPLVSHAGQKDRSLLVPLCTIDGITHFQEIQLGKAPLEQRSAQHGEHCKLCVFGGDRDVAALAPIAFCSVPPVSNAGVAPYAVLFFPPACLSPTQPRAPPQSS